MPIFVLFVVTRWSKMARQRLESSGIDALSVEARNHVDMRYKQGI